MTSIWFTADTHFGHKAMAATGKGWRPFDTVEQHDEFLVRRWNAVVKPEDQVWHLGDVGLSSEAHTLEMIARCNGTKHLITGNHDPVWPGHRVAHKHQRRWLEVFASVQAFARRRIDGRDVLLSHFPYAGDHTEEPRFDTYRPRDTGLWLLHGHVHDAWQRNGRQINVGVDAWGYGPLHLSTVTDIIREDLDARRILDQ